MTLELTPSEDTLTDTVTHPEHGLSTTLFTFNEGRRLNYEYYFYDSKSDDYTIEPTEENKRNITIPFDSTLDGDNYSPSFSLHRFWLFTGPGWLMSIAYLDPGNLESDLQAGVVTEYKLIWVLFYATILGFLLQSLAARLGCVTGKNLAQLCRYEYPKGIGLTLWILTELAIIGSDIQEVIGSAIAIKLLFGIDLWIGVLITGFDTFTFLLLHYWGIKYVEIFFCSLIGIMAICFGIEFIIGKPDGVKILKGWAVPNVPKGGVEQSVAMLGAVIMPHNLFLHSALVETRIILRSHKGAIKEANYYFTMENAISLFVSFLINLSIISVFAKGFYNNSEYNNDIGLRLAGKYLGDRFGTLAKYIWAIGLLAAGQSSTMTGTLAGQYTMAGFLHLNWSPWKRVLFTRSIALVPALFIGVSATSSFDSLNEWLNVQQSIQLPFALLPLLIFNSNNRIMGEFTLSNKSQIFYWFISLIIIFVNIYLVIYFSNSLKNIWYKWLLFCIVIILYLWFIIYLIYDFWKQKSSFLLCLIYINYIVIYCDTL